MEMKDKRQRHGKGWKGMPDPTVMEGERREGEGKGKGFARLCNVKLRLFFSMVCDMCF